MTLFLGNNNAAPDTSGISIRLSRNDILFDLADLNGDGILEILTLRRDGIYVNSLSSLAKNGFRIPQFRPLLSKERIEERLPVKESENQIIHSWGETSCLIQTSSTFSAPDPTHIRRFPLALDLDEDGQPEICASQSDRLLVYRLMDGAYKQATSFWIRPVYLLTDSDPAEMTIRLPVYQLSDFNGDGKKDLLAIQQSRVDVFLLHDLPDQSSDALVPPDWTYDLSAQRMALSDLETLAPVSTHIEALDLNNDGLTDFLVTLAARAGFASSLSQLHIHLNRYGRISLLPDQILTTDNFLGEHLEQDFNGDSLIDLALFDFRLSYGMAARLILTRKVTHRYNFYLMQPDGSYPQKPDFQYAVSKKPHVSDPESALFGACYAGDFNGDGLTDLITPLDQNRWQAVLGDSAMVLNKKGRFTLNVPLTRSLEIADLNGDEADDCIFLFPDDVKLRNQVRIVLSVSSGDMTN